VRTSEDLRFRGLVHQVTDVGVLDRLDRDRVTLYYGCDPSAPSLHVGQLVQLCLLRRLQRAGHRPIALAGGATGAIGDPGGKDEERQLLHRQQLEENVAGIRRQLERFVELDDASGGAGTARGGRAVAGTPAGLVVDNRSWWSQMDVVRFLREVGKRFTVNQMVAKESVRQRFERPDHGISYTEFSYMLLQAYDFLRLHDDYGCELQVGGSDQWGNITMGVELVRKVRRREVHGLTTPLVTRADGTKFGKTEEGTVWLDPARTSPYRFYQFFVQAEDRDVGTYLRYFTWLSRPEIEGLEAETWEHPERRSAQRELAREVTAMVHGAQEAARAEQASEALFRGTLSTLDEATLEEVTAEVPSSTLARAAVVDGAVAGGGVAAAGGGEDHRAMLTDVLVESGLVSSRGEARRAATQGGIYVNDQRQSEVDRAVVPEDLLHGRFLVLRRGKRQYHVVRAV
jgi:tyrosyl-tRNA synthetase